MKELEGVVKDLKSLEKFLPGYARTVYTKKKLEKVIEEFNHNIDFLRQFPVLEPLYRFEPVEKWVEVVKQRKEPIGFVSKMLYKVTSKYLDFLIEESYFIPVYAKECCYCGNKDYLEVRPFAEKEDILLVCEKEKCKEKLHLYVEAKPIQRP